MFFFSFTLYTCLLFYYYIVHTFIKKKILIPSSAYDKISPKWAVLFNNYSTLPKFSHTSFPPIPMGWARKNRWKGSSSWDQLCEMKCWSTFLKESTSRRVVAWPFGFRSVRLLWTSAVNLIERIPLLYKKFLWSIVFGDVWLCSAG